jgi:hypothetical protein
MVLIITSSATFLLLSFWFCTKKGKDHLSHANEGSPSHLLQCHDRQRINTEHEADSTGFPPVLKDSPVAGIQCSIPPTESINTVLCIFHRAQKQSHYSLIGREIIQAHQFEPTALPSLKSLYLITGLPLTGAPLRILTGVPS